MAKKDEEKLLSIKESIEGIKELASELEEIFKDSKASKEEYDGHRIEINLRAIALLIGCSTPTATSRNKKGEQQVKISIFRRLPSDLEKMEIFNIMRQVENLDNSLFKKSSASTSESDHVCLEDPTLFSPIVVPDKINGENFKSLILRSTSKYLKVHDLVTINLLATELKKRRILTTILVGSAIMGAAAAVYFLTKKSNKDEDISSDCDCDDAIDYDVDPEVTIEEDMPVTVEDN